MYATFCVRKKGNKKTHLLLFFTKRNTGGKTVKLDTYRVGDWGDMNDISLSITFGSCDFWRHVNVLYLKNKIKPRTGAGGQTLYLEENGNK